MIRLISLVTVALCLQPAVADWPEFRGPTTAGLVTASGLPTHWSPSQNIVWRTEIPGEGWSSPVVVGDTIYLTAAIPNTDDVGGYDLVLILVGGRAGEIVRQVPLFREPATSPKIHPKNSHASPTPLFDGENLFVHFGHQGTACLSLAGDVIWKNDSLGYPPVHGNGGCPIVVDNLLIFSRDGADISEVTALDKRTGEIAWQTQRGVEVGKKFSFCTPLLLEDASRRQLILPGSNVVQSLEPGDGSEHWRVAYDGYSVIPRPILQSGLVFVCTGYDRPSLLAIDPTGKGDVTTTHVKWREDSGIPKTPSLVGFDGRIASVSDDGIASCFDASSGKLLWKERIGGNFSASPVLASHYWYLLDEEGTCTVLDVSGAPQEVAINKLNERSLASPAVLDSDLLIRTSAALYRITATQ